MAPSFLDKVEIFCCNMYDMTRAHRSVITGVLGYVLLFNSGQYLGIVLLMQGVRVAGLSLFDKSLNELYDTYIRTRVAVQEAMPDASALIGLQEKLSNAARDLKISKISKEDYERMAKDMAELQEALNRSQSFISSITKAVDPNKLSEILANLHLFFLSVTAIATSTSAATVTIGLNMGKVLSDRSYSVLLQAREIFSLPKALTSGSGAGVDYPGTMQSRTSTSADKGPVGPDSKAGPGSTENQWIRSLMHMVGNSIGLSVAYFMQKTAVTFGGCMMGSEFLLTSFEELADPLLDHLTLPTLKRNATAKLLIQGSMVTMGFLSQMRGYNMGTETGIMRILLSPIIIAEACVQAYILAAMLKQDP